MFYMVDNQEECIITSDINVFNRYYFQSIDPNIYRSTNLIELLRKKLETDCGLDEEATSVWSKERKDD